MQVYNQPKGLLSVFFLSNTCFVCVKETSHGDVSLTYTKYMCFIESYQNSS